VAVAVAPAAEEAERRVDVPNAAVAVQSAQAAPVVVRSAVQATVGRKPRVAVSNRVPVKIRAPGRPVAHATANVKNDL